jgi:hypothetical protein
MMNATEVRAQINQKLSHLSPEQLNSVWEFIESLESETEMVYQDSTQTILEQMGGYPRDFLEGSGDLSDRDRRKRIIAEKVKQKHQERQQYSL